MDRADSQQGRARPQLRASGPVDRRHGCSSTRATPPLAASRATAPTTWPADSSSPAGKPTPPTPCCGSWQCYLAFLTHAQDGSGAFHNRLSNDRRWTDEPGLGDWWGRALWGLGTAAARSPAPWIRIEALTASTVAASRRSTALRAMTFAGLGARCGIPAPAAEYDGLTPHGPNLNQGAESTLAFISTLQPARSPNPPAV
ncbi:hypothetical protein GCM10010170_080700 [Dactylosporangium salmoneum]|uniref:Uncharacterized protein n=1 Tax=Dactylosporangium salmoneum TaxID=53361 RepID=A0ABP5UF60_9ACTN